MGLRARELEISQSKRERAVNDLTRCLFRLSAMLVKNEGESESALGEGPARRRGSASPQACHRLVCRRPLVTPHRCVMVMFEGILGNRTERSRASMRVSMLICHGPRVRSITMFSEHS